MLTKFSERIKELRSEKEMNQADFAKFISTNQSTLSAYENGDRFPPYETLISICQQCKVSLDWLSGLSDKKNSCDTLETYSDLIKIIMLLKNTTKIDINFSMKSHIGQGLSNTTVETLLCEIDDKNIVDFYQEWKDILSICKKSSNGDKLYNIWLKDIFERYNFELENTKQVEPLPFD